MLDNSRCKREISTRMQIKQVSNLSAVIENTDRNQINKFSLQFSGFSCERTAHIHFPTSSPAINYYYAGNKCMSFSNCFLQPAGCYNIIACGMPLIERRLDIFRLICCDKRSWKAPLTYLTAEEIQGRFTVRRRCSVWHCSNLIFFGLLQWRGN